MKAHFERENPEIQGRWIPVEMVDPPHQVNNQKYHDRQKSLLVGDHHERAWPELESLMSGHLSSKRPPLSSSKLQPRLKSLKNDPK